MTKAQTKFLLSISMPAPKIERKRGKLQFFRHTQMDTTVLIPGLPVTVEVGNADGQIEANKILCSRRVRGRDC